MGAEQDDERAARVLADLLDEVERVLVVVVHDDDRQVGVLAGDVLGGLPDVDGVRRHRVTEPGEQLVGRAQRRLVLVGGEDAQARVVRVVAHASAVKLHSCGLGIMTYARPCSPPRAAQRPSPPAP